MCFLINRYFPACDVSRSFLHAAAGQQVLKFFRRIDVAASRAADLYALSGGFDDDFGLVAVDAFHNFHRYRERLGNDGSTWRHSRSRAFR